MPDITYRFIGEDQLTPMINQLKGALDDLSARSQRVGSTAAAPQAGAAPQGVGTTLGAQMQQAQSAAGGLTAAINNTKSATAALGQQAQATAAQITRSFAAAGAEQIAFGKRIYDELQKIPGMTVERAKGMIGGTPKDIADQSAALDAYVAHQKRAQQDTALDAYVAHQKRAQQDIADAAELAEAKQQFRREERLDRNAQAQIQSLERQARQADAQFRIAPPKLTDAPGPSASSLGRIKEDMEGAKGAGEGLGSILGTIGGHLARMPAYVLAFKALEIAMQTIGHVSSVLIPNIQDVDHWMNIAAASGENWAASYNDLRQAAALTNTALGDTQKRAMVFMQAGSSMEEAAKQAGMVQQGIQQTGVDLTDVYAKAQVYGATLQDALKAGIGHPAIAESALQDALFQNTLKFRENDMQKRQHAAQYSYELEHRGIQRAREDREESANYVLEDRHRAETYAMEDSHRATRRQMEEKRTAIEDNLEDTQHAEDRAQEMRHTGMEREMEDRHTLLEREMEDRHKAEGRAQQDAQREHQERLAIAQSVGGAEQAVAEGRGMVVGQIKGKRVRVPIPESIQATIKAEQEEGYAELEREGVSRSEAQYMIRAHVMSPGALTQAAEKARERKAEAADRQRDDEAQKQERQFQDESRQQGRNIHDEGVALSEVQYKRRTEASRGLRNEERAAGYKMEDEQTGQTRRQAQESQDQSRSFRDWDKRDARREQDDQSGNQERNYREQQGLKDEGLDRDRQRQDDLNDLQRDQLADYDKRTKETIGGLENMAPAIGGQALIRAPYVHERSMFKGGQALKTKDDAVLRKVQELINIFLK